MSDRNPPSRRRTRRCAGAGVLVLLAALTSPPTSAGPPKLACEGILGNSGERGGTLVRFGPPWYGIGVVYDRFGSLWSGAGQGGLNRYALDGRLLARYPIPRGSAGSADQDHLTAVGDLLVLKLNGALYTLPVDATPGTAPRPLKVEASRLSFGSRDGWLAASRGKDLFLVRAGTGETRPFATLDVEPTWLEMGPDGAVYPVTTVSDDWRVRRLVGGREAAGAGRKGPPGERPQLVDSSWFGHSWSGTIRRFDAGLEPAPGVVLGGASGSFIGHLDMNPEVENGRGLAKVRDGLYAVSGFGGVVHLLAWDDRASRFEIVRRIGSVPRCRGLGLDRAGNVWWFAGSWRWGDSPVTPLRNGIEPPPSGEAPGSGQAVMLDGDRMLAPGWKWGKPAFFHGDLAHELAADRVEAGCALQAEPAGAAVYRQAGESVLLVVDGAGAARGFKVSGDDGRYLGELGPVALRTESPLKRWTTLAMIGPDTLLAAADGFVVEFARAGAGWQESRRWRAWGPGPADSFGATIFIAADSGRLWVSDRDRHRVLGFHPRGGAPLAAFGHADAPGDDLDSLSHPEAIAARGARVVVFDGGNQRLVKLGVR